MDDASHATLPPQAVLYQLATGHYVTRALDLVARLGIADLLKDGPRTAEELAAPTGTHAPSLRRVLRLLVSRGVFAEEESGAFALNPLGECLREGIPGSAWALVRLFTGVRIQEAWADLEYCVRTGDPAFRKRGIVDNFAEMARDPETTAVFDMAMADFTKIAAIAVAANYDFSALRTVVDVGGGNGALLIGILDAHPHLHGVVFDQEHAAARAREQIAARGLAARCQAVGGDFFAEVPSGGDGYLLKHVIHDWDNERATTILRNCRRAMAPTGTLLLVEGTYPPRVEQSLASRGAAANDVNMLVNTGGRQRSEEEFRSLFAAAGFTLTRIIPTPINVSVIEGKPRG
ncbi:MAG: methyltransferase [Deltaproteobacteria bacterium]|nr:MAG: methyltransferase [Deltaproteobacteria bacterium]